MHILAFWGPLAPHGAPRAGRGGGGKQSGGAKTLIYVLYIMCVCVFVCVLPLEMPRTSTNRPHGITGAQRYEFTELEWIVDKLFEPQYRHLAIFKADHSNYPNQVLVNEYIGNQGIGFLAQPKHTSDGCMFLRLRELSRCKVPLMSVKCLNRPVECC